MDQTINGYLSIQEAFKQGEGDVFFNRNDKYITVSRHDEQGIIDKLSEGWELMKYEEVLKATLFDAPTVTSAVIFKKVHDCINQAKQVKSQDNISNGRTGYYDEYPDAMGQYL